MCSSDLVAKDTLPRVGITPGLTVTLARVEIDTETGKIYVKEMLAVGDSGTILHPQAYGQQMRGGNVMGLGMALLERHSYDPKLGLPASTSIERSRLPTYLDVPVENNWVAVDLPDPSNPVGVKGVAEPALGSAAAALTSAVSDALGGVLFNRTPITFDMILNALAGRPQSVKPMQLNV